MLSIRINEENPNHHIWDNNGTWFINYVTYPKPHKKKRVRISLGTKCIKIARERRDEIFKKGIK